MASDTRAAKRRADRTKAKAAGNGGPPKPPVDAKVTADDGQPAETGALDGALVKIVRGDDGGFTVVGCVGVGDVRPAEVPIVLEKAVAFERKRLGLPAL